MSPLSAIQQQTLNSSEMQSSTESSNSASEVQSTIRKEDYLRFGISLTNSKFCTDCGSCETSSKKAKLKQFVKQIKLPCVSNKESSSSSSAEQEKEQKVVDQNVGAVINNCSSNSTEKNEKCSTDVENTGGMKKKKSKILKYRGFMFAIVSSLCFSLTALIVKYLKEYDAVNLALWRFQGTFLPAIPLMLYHHFDKQRTRRAQGIPEGKKQKEKWGTLKIVGLLVLRSIFTCNALLLHFYSLKYLDLGDASVILSSTPVFAYIIAFLILREPLGIVPIGTAITTLFGVIFILRPPVMTGNGNFDHNTLVGVGLALGSTVLATVSYVLLRYSRNVHFSLTTFFFGAWGTFENLLVALALGVLSFPHGTTHWWLGAASAFLAFVGQIAIILALKYEKAGPVTLIRTVDVLFGFLWQILFWKMVPDAFSLIGASIVVSGVAVIGIRKWIGTLPEDDKIRLKFGFMLK